VTIQPGQHSQDFEIVPTFAYNPFNVCNGDSSVAPADAYTTEYDPEVPITILPSFFSQNTNEKVRVILHEIGHKTRSGRHLDAQSEIQYDRMIRILCGL
jgi:hypothetical protein